MPTLSSIVSTRRTPSVVHVWHRAGRTPWPSWPHVEISHHPFLTLYHHHPLSGMGYSPSLLLSTHHQWSHGGSSSSLLLLLGTYPYRLGHRHQYNPFSPFGLPPHCWDPVSGLSPLSSHRAMATEWYIHACEGSSLSIWIMMPLANCLWLPVTLLTAFIAIWDAPHDTAATS